MSVQSIYNLASLHPVDGTSGPDNLKGTTHKNNLGVRVGDDNLINGHDANDRINGGDGDDFLVGGQGNDSLIGGKGNDVFSYQSFLDGKDRIHDFKHGADFLDLSDLGITADDLSITTQGRDQVHTITFDGHAGAEIVVVGKGFDLSDIYFG